MIGLPDSTKGAIKGHIVFSSPWAGSYEHPGREFDSRHSLAISGRVDHSSLVFSVLLIMISLLIHIT